MSTNVNACRYCGALPGSVHSSICPSIGVVTPLEAFLPKDTTPAKVLTADATAKFRAILAQQAKGEKK